MRKSLIPMVLLVVACEGSTTEPVEPPVPDLSQLAGEWDVRGRLGNAQWFTRLGGTVTIGSAISGQSTGVVGDWTIHTARLPMQYTYADTVWNQGTPRELVSTRVGNGTAVVEVTAAVHRSGRGGELLQMRLDWPLPRRPNFPDLMYVSAPELNPRVLVGAVPAAADSMGWRMTRR